MRKLLSVFHAALLLVRYWIEPLIPLYFTIRPAVGDQRVALTRNVTRPRYRLVDMLTREPRRKVVVGVF
ncbi:hypothetical protein GCM10027572_26640 [Flexivirga lutea]